MAQVHVLRHLVLGQGRSQRSVAKELGISRNTVARYLDDNVTAGVRVVKEPRKRPVYDKVKAAVFGLMDEAKVTQKQRLTSPRVHELLQEQGIETSDRTIRRAMREYRRVQAETAVPLEFLPGEHAEVDFFEVVVILNGVRQKAWMFLIRLMHSGRDFARLYHWQDQAAFLDGHVRAFAHFGGVPMKMVYDNLKPAVQRVLTGSERELNARFLAMVTHYAYTPRFARPRRGSDKGGVESRGKNIRLQHLTPIPEADSLQVINEQLLARLDARMATTPRRRGEPTIAELWEVERKALLPLPEVPHSPGIYREKTVDGKAQVRVKGARYSVPSRWKKLQVRVWLYADELHIVHDGETILHPRQPGDGSHIWYPHYLEELAGSPRPSSRSPTS